MANTGAQGSYVVDAEANPTVDAVAGAGGALLALLTTYPLMTLNVYQHTSQKLRAKACEDVEDSADGDEGASDTESISSNTTPTPKKAKKERTPIIRAPLPLEGRKTFAGDLADLMREGGGVSALYRGIEPAVIGTVTSQAVYHFFYSTLRTFYIKKQKENPGALSSLGIASIAGSINVLLTIPIWTVVTRMQAATNKHQQQRVITGTGMGTGMRAGTGTRENMGTRLGTRHTETRTEVDEKKGFLATTLAVWEDSGAAGFWQGVVPSLVMVSNPALQYMFYEGLADRLKARHLASRQKNNAATAVVLTAAEVFLAGALAKLGATVITYPILLVKSRLQAMGKSTDQSMRYAGTLDALRRIVKDEGVGAFYRGMGTKVTQTVFAAALMFAAKEEIAKAVKLAYVQMMLKHKMKRL
uniref:ADP,ATP carrier protein n=1 Tax=Mantoniella antarctica TaxID=81844 RepID=A0A7S0SNU7_9CHLO|mmetsp:Transcript_30366/g.75964  ORF Transcript_30366/g.75964 Transcript_30366/m.75964 type:complete len:415 (+) Transcript_30366:131-1375(+)|eukprot:CAMPEP_0181364298 /NCGR_PEP_ID=MMETSP1106-20121128/9303_1 /TAXON_ID=81844 /ORGANISM="Mantoniella antarctica, Strain SL-175" /LENGTH=414 /DNA_ID=CAMNT_0023478985 /DNA_START=40 /DNA_END=1284 /DNA_ORIENTATION=+